MKTLTPAHVDLSGFGRIRSAPVCTCSTDAPNPAPIPSPLATTWNNTGTVWSKILAMLPARPNLHKRRAPIADVRADAFLLCNRRGSAVNMRHIRGRTVAAVGDAQAESNRNTTVCNSFLANGLVPEPPSARSDRMAVILEGTHATRHGRGRPPLQARGARFRR